MLANLLLFLSSSIAITIAPGPDNIQVLTRALTQGRAAGLAAALGFSFGCLFHTSLAVLGIAALLRTSPMAFDALKLAGAGYLMWLAVQAARSRGAFASAAAATGASRWKVFRQSVLANMLNPKVTLFFLVFLPQFVDPWAGRSDTQMLMLGVIFMVQAAVIFCLIACCAGFLGGILRRRPQTGKYLDWLAGAVFLLLAVRIVWLS